MNTLEPSGNHPKNVTAAEGKPAGFTRSEDEFFEDADASVARAIHAAAEDIAGRPLTKEEFDAIQAEVQQRLEREKSDIRRFLERHGKSLMRLMAVLLGFSTFSAESRPTHPAEPDGQITASQEKEIVKTATELAAEKELGDDFLTIVELGLGAYKGTLEYYGRTGRPEWPTLERLHYSKLPTENKLYALHPEFAEYSDQEFLTNFELLMGSARTEFMHTDLREQLATGAIDRLVRLAPTLEAQELIDAYDTLVPDLEHEMGINYTVRLRTDLHEVLSPDHPLQGMIAGSHLAADQLLLDKSNKKTTDGQHIQRTIVFDQERGVVDIQATVGQKTTLLSSFPGNGGDPRFSSTGNATKEFAATRAGEYRVRQLEIGHVSPSWPNSLIPQNAEITQVDGEVMYATADGRFHYATGPKAEFIGRTPFDGQMTAADRALLISAGQPVKIDKNDTEGIQEMKDQGGWLVSMGAEKLTYVMPMTPFKVDNFTDSKTKELVTRWKKNDFGPRSLIFETLDGQRSQQLFHSSNPEIKTGTFLENSHGCIHMYQEDLGDVFTYVDRGDTIRITSPYLRVTFGEDIPVKADLKRVAANEG